MRVGVVSLVGAGPGDPGLMTVRGLERLRRADVVVYDRLVDPRLLDEAPPRAVLVFAGKESGSHTLPQAEINAMLIAHARRGLAVVRLKGGDPFVFGRGAEEAGALAAASVPFEIVPGVSSAIAVPERAGIPLTHRRLASSFAVVTGHECDGKSPAVRWGRIADGVDTLVILMGLANLSSIVTALLIHGRSTHTPVAVIQCGTTASEAIVTGSLGDIVERAEAARLTTPALIVVGEVVRFRERLTGIVDSCDPALARASCR